MQLETTNILEFYFKKKATLVKLELIFPIHKKTRKSNSIISDRNIISSIINTTLNTITNQNSVILYPIKKLKIPSRKKTYIKRRDSIRNLFLKVTLRATAMTTFIHIWIQTLIYKNSVINTLFRQKEVIELENTTIFYRKKKKASIAPCSDHFKRNVIYKYYSFKFPIKILHFPGLMNYQTIIHILLDMQINIIVQSFSKKEALLLLKKYNYYK